MNYNNKERGSVFVFTILILGSMLAITLALLAIFEPKLRVAQDAGSSSVKSIYAADSGIEWCIYTNRGNPALAQPVLSNGATYAFTNSCNPGFGSDTAVGTYKGVSRSLEVDFP